MTKAELIATVSAAADMPQKAVEMALNATLDTIATAVGHGETVTIPGFGTFGTKHREARKCRNPQTGEEMEAPACTVPSFKAGSRLKAAVSDGMEIA